MSINRSIVQPDSHDGYHHYFAKQRKDLRVSFLKLIFLGALGAHKNYLNDKPPAIVYKLLGLVSLLIAPGTAVVGLVGGIVDPVWGYVMLSLSAGIALFTLLPLVVLLVFDAITLSSKVARYNVALQRNLLNTVPPDVHKGSTPN